MLIPIKCTPIFKCMIRKMVGILSRYSDIQLVGWKSNQAARFPTTFHKGRHQKKKTGYRVTLSLKVGGLLKKTPLSVSFERVTK